ncbi:S1C family serine protease [Piscinibacter terrae]|uniref:Peptidase S1 n=1 Tax=Piscinibacter terrae TaxID=2496871 RepID=A0A3N7HW75_9BURK|nr:trypsin-like peptidase domain-containing protein [Albitalea terrae]RQP26103.1 peptidase S1 [Albitalea terrae]
MKKAPLYSRSRHRLGSTTRPEVTVPARDPSTAPSSPPPTAAGPIPAATAPAAIPTRRQRLHQFFTRHRAPLWAAVAVLLVFTGAGLQRAMLAPSRILTQEDIDNAVKQSLVKEVLPSPYARAYAAIRPSVVRIVGSDDDKDDPKPGDDPRLHSRSTGTGVVIVDNGTILTNLHVVAGSKRIRVTFADGHESDANLVSVQAENDLAVLRAKSIPDDLQPATMRGTGDLIPGDEVLAVGFPFGIGPSASGGVISGLKRSFRAPEGERLTNLIQFDAAANPGNSGGPLVTMDGAVVGIVTAILNPGEQGTFIGIGFAVPIENAAAAAGMPPF